MLHKTVGQYLRHLFALDDTPERIALAFALGVFLAFSPLLGLHTILGLSIAFIFGLNRVAVLLGVFVNNPWTLVPIYGTATYIGGLLIGFPEKQSLPPIDWNTVWHGSFWIHTIRQLHVLKLIVVGSTILSVLGAVLSYPVALYMVRQGKAFRLKVRKHNDR